MLDFAGLCSGFRSAKVPSCMFCIVGSLDFALAASTFVVYYMILGDGGLFSKIKVLGWSLFSSGGDE